MSDQDQAFWLVKSSGRILGPYTKNRIRDLLREKEVVALDEVGLPKRKWNYIRDQKEFSGVLEELRIQQIKSGSDKTQTVGSHIDDITGSVTEAIIEDSADELTSDVEPLNFELTQEIPIQGDLEITAARDVTKTGRVVETNEPSSKRYGTEEQAKKNVSSFAQRLWRTTLYILAFSAILLVVNHYVLSPKSKSTKNYSELTIADAFYTNGMYERALKYYKKAYESGHENKEPLLRYGTLLIQLDRNTVEGVNLLQESLNFDPRNRVYVYAGIGLANIFDGNHIFANKHLREALNIEPNLTSAIVNLGWLRQREGAIDEAIDLYSSSIIKGAGRVDNSPYIYLSKALIEKWKKSGNQKYLDEAKNTLLSIVDNKTDYRQEALLLLTYIYSQASKSEDYFSTLERTLDTDPLLTSEHSHDLNIYHDGISWGSFIRMCDEIYEKNKQDSSAVALSGYCLLKGKDLVRAEQRFKELANKRTQSPLLLAVHAFYHQVVGNESHAAITLGKAIEGNKSGRKYSLPLILEARTCQEIGDDECALKKWKELLQKEEKNIQALSNIVILQTKKGNIQGLDTYVRDARLISDNYAPARYAETFLYDTKNK